MRILAETLTKDYVSIQSDEYGTRAYENSERGRAWLQEQCPAEIVSVVLGVWGDVATVSDEVQGGLQ